MDFPIGEVGGLRADQIILYFQEQVQQALQEAP
jgi:hypothetical protein